MQHTDIWRGCLYAYAACVLTFSAVLAIGTQPAPQVLAGIVFGVALYGAFGIIIFLPATGLAFATNVIYRSYVTRAKWWHCALIITAWAIALILPLVGASAGLVWAIGISVVASPAFWLGAVGKRWSVPVDRGGSSRRP